MNSGLLKELRELVRENVISQETANKIEAFYKTKKEDNNKFTLILSILGTILVGLGIVLVIAHNWDQFNRTLKTSFAFLPLALSQVLCFYVIRKKMDSVSWKECAATFLFFSVGACISLISQIYHISGTLSGFLFVWMLLTVPLVYLFSSFVVTLLYIGGVTWYACIVGYGYPSHVPYWYFLFMIILVPAYLRIWKNKPDGNAVIVLNWLMASSFACCLGAFSPSDSQYEFIFGGYITLFILYYLAGTGETHARRTVMANAFFSLGLSGILVILMMWSFEWLWNDMDPLRSLSYFLVSPFAYISVLLFFLVAYLLIKRHAGRGGEPIDPVGFSSYLFLLAILFFHQLPKAGVLVINLWLLLIALYYIRKGSLRAHLGILNFGLLIITALALFRFFDESIPFVWRGIIFLLTGVGIFAANFIIIKRKKSLAANKES